MAEVQQHDGRGAGGGSLVAAWRQSIGGRRGISTRVVYHFYTGSLAGIGIDIPYTGTRWSVFLSVFLGVSKILADVIV